MRRFKLVLGGLVCLGVLAAGTGAAAADGTVYGPQAVWKPAGPVLQKWLACQDLACKQQVMRANGASAQALEFLRQSKGRLMTSFAELGRVDLAWGALAGAALQGQYYLLNGRPGLLGVDDAAQAARKDGSLDLAANPGYKRLLSRRPRTGLWQCRGFEGEDTSAAGQRFIFSFYLREGCQSCPKAGLAFLAFDFNARGEFLGLKLMGLFALR